MFDRTACPDAEPLTAQPFVSIDALAALSALLDLALKDRTPSVSLLSGASRTSHDENRGDTHVTRDGNAREQIPAQCYSAWGPDADRHDKPLIHMPLEGSCFGVDSQNVSICGSERTFILTDREK
jgi:hypothetical protein